MKKVLLSIGSAVLLLGIVTTVDAQVSNPNYWKLSGGNVAPISSGWNLQVGALGGNGQKCLHVDNTGLVSVSSGDCASGTVTASGTVGDVQYSDGAGGFTA